MRWLAATIVLLGPMAFGQSGTPLTLPEALRIGREHSPLLRISAAKMEGAEAKAGEARASRLPSVKFEGSYRKLSAVDPFVIALPIFPRPVQVGANLQDNTSLRVGVQQPLFTGFKLAASVHAAEALADASGKDNLNDQADLDYAITAAYWTLSQAQEVKKAVDENVTRLQSFERDTDRLVKAGIATRNDLLKVQVQLSNARLAQIDAVNDVEVAMMNLNTTMGQTVDTDLQPATTVEHQFSADSASGAAESAAPVSVDARPDLQATQARIEAAEASLTAANGGWWPQVFLNGNYYYNRPNARYQPVQDAYKATWDLGVLVQFDIWNWGTTKFQTEQAEAAVRQNRALMDQQKNGAAQEIRRNGLAVRRATDKIQVARVGITQAEENLRSTTDKFKSGLSTSTDLLDANVSLLQARVSYTASLVEYELALARFRKAAGKAIIAER